MKTEREGHKIVYLKGDIYVFGGWNQNNNNLIKSVDKYSLTSKTWSQIAKINDDCISFSLCAFIDKIFVIGGFIDGIRISSCLQFNTSNNVWKIVSKMNEARLSSVCAIFEERIVACGGFSNNVNSLDSVESYDVLPNKWSTMANMNSGKQEHSLVVVKNKLFVISSQDHCEVYDNICNNFITIKSPKFNWLYSIRAYSIENKIFALQDNLSKICSYDNNKNEWSKESCKNTTNLKHFACVNIPCL